MKMQKTFSKIAVLLMLVCSAMIFTSASKSNVVKIKGTVSSYGNAPFNYPVISTTDSKKYIAVGTQELKEKLLENQLVVLEFEGYFVDNEEDLLDGYFEVIKWKKSK